MKKMPLNRQSQILVSHLLKPKKKIIQTYACGVPIQMQWPAMLVDCTQILIWVSVSWDKACVSLISKCTLRWGCLGLYLRKCSLKLKSGHNMPTLQVLPLDRHLTCLYLDVIFFFSFYKVADQHLIWLVERCFSSKRTKYFGTYAYNIPTHRNLLYNRWIIFYTTP